MGKISVIQVVIVKASKSWKKATSLLPQLTHYIDLAGNLSVAETDGGALGLSLMWLKLLWMLISCTDSS